jgi:hypothetical protein
MASSFGGRHSDASKGKRKNTRESMSGLSERDVERTTETADTMAWQTRAFTTEGFCALAASSSRAAEPTLLAWPWGSLRFFGYP